MSGDDDLDPIPVRHLTLGEQRIMKRALLRSSRPDRAPPAPDDDLDPIRTGPPEPPGPPPRRRWIFAAPMWLAVGIIVVMALAAAILILVPSKWGFG